MKNLLFACILCLLATISARSQQVVTNTLNPTTLAGTPAAPVTNYSAPVIVGYVTFSRVNPSFIINQAGLNNTNSAIFYPGISTGTNPTNMTQISTNQFSSTAAGALTVPPGNLTIPIYGSVMTVVTNSTQVWQSVIHQ